MAKGNCTCPWDEQLIAAEDDCCNAHTKTGQVVRCQTVKTFIRQQAQLVADPLWKLSQCSELRMEMKRRNESSTWYLQHEPSSCLIEGQIEVETSDWLVV